MGKSNTPTKWFKAVKKAFRSPSKERPPSDDTKVDADEKPLTAKHDLSPVSQKPITAKHDLSPVSQKPLTVKHDLSPVSQKPLTAKHDLSPVSHQGPTPHPLPSFEIITFDEVEPEHIRGQPLPTPEAVDPAISANLPDKEKNEVEEEDDTSNNVAHVEEKHQDDDDDSALSEEEEAAIRIQQRFEGPLALKGLIRLQALVRGHQVRRQAATTLRTMEAIVRVQALVRGHHVRMSKGGRAVRSRILRHRRLSSRAGIHGNVSKGESQDKEPKTSKGDEEANKRKRPTGYLLTQQLKRSTPNRSLLFIDCRPGQLHRGWAWLELWTNARPWEIHQLEDSKDFIEIIPSRENSEFTTKEVDVNTLKVKCYEDYISNPTPAKSASSSPLSMKKEPESVVPDWQHSTRTPTPSPTPVPIPAPPASSTTAQSHRTLPKPPPIEVPSHPAVEEDGTTQVELRTPEVQKSPGREKSTSPSPAGSEDSIPVPPSPQASDTSLPVPETPPGLDSAGDESSAIMEHLVLPEAHMANGGETNGELMNHSSSLSASDGAHQPGEDSPSAKGSASDVVNGHTSNGHQENGDKLSRKGEKVGESGDSPVPSKRTTCRYMAATESAKAKFRSASNPKTRTPDTPESPVRTPKRYSIGGGRAADSPKTAFGTRRINSFQNRGSPSPKAGGLKEKSRSGETGAESPARRNSLGGAVGMRWRT